jgi:flagellar basal-body rod modification protein FlgD
VAWDGKDQNGVKLSDGTYTFRVSAVDGSGQSILTSTSMVGTVTGISFENGITYLMIGSGKITLSDITSILS